MIVFLIPLIPIILLVEYLLYRERNKLDSKASQIHVINTELELTKSLAFLMTEKNKTLDEAAQAFSVAFFTQQTMFDTIILNITKQRYSGTKCLRFHKDAVLNADHTASALQDQSKTISLPLSFRGTVWGNILFSKTSSNVQPDTAFLKVVVNMVVILIKRFEFDSLLTKEEQIKAVNVKW